MTNSIRGRGRVSSSGAGSGGDDGGFDDQKSVERSLGYYKHSYDDDFVYNANLNSHTNYTQLVQNYETTAKSYANNATIIARGYYDAANAGDWDAAIVPLLAITVVLSFCLGCCVGRCGRGNDKDDYDDNGEDDGVEDLLSMGSRKTGRRNRRQKTRKTRNVAPSRRYNVEQSFTETDNESYYDRYDNNETDDDDDDDDDSNGTGYYYEPPVSPSSLSDYRSAQRESAARRKARAATKRAAIAMKAKATAEAALALATAKSDIDGNEEKVNADWSTTSKKTEEVVVEKKKEEATKAKSSAATVSPSSPSEQTQTTASKKTRQWGKLVAKKKIDPLLEARSRSHNFVGYYVT